MARSDRSRVPDDEQRRRTEPALTLSTGRLEGRPSSATDARTHRGTRHNPLRDEYPSRRDDPRPHRTSDDWSSSSTRHGSAASRPSGRSGRAERSDRGARGHDRRSSASFAAQPSRSRSISPRPPLDGRAVVLGVIAVVLVGVFAMALLHIGPFAKKQAQDPTTHLGAISLSAVANNGSSLSQGIATRVSLATPVEPELDKLPPHTPTREDIEALSGQETPFAFTCSSDESATAPILSDRSLVALSNALAYYDNNGREASYLMMDMTTGRGIAGNLDAAIYGASSFKGPFCTYVTQRELPDDINAASSSRTTQIEDAIIWSDNASYEELRRDFGTAGMKEWLSEAGVNESLADDTHFPTYTGRQAALMWLKIYDYLENADTSAAQWLSNTFSKTEVSFLRNGALGTTSAGHTDYLPTEDSGEEERAEAALGTEGSLDVASDGEDQTVESADETAGELTVATDDAAGSEGTAHSDTTKAEPVVDSLGDSVKVRNKAGWIAGKEDDAVCDSGIVTINGHNYLMVIMTSAADSAEGEQAFAQLTRTLFEIRGDLV